MRRRLAAIATAVATTVGLVLTVAPSASAAGMHHLMVYKPDYVNSVYISTVDGAGRSYTACSELGPWGEGWRDGQQELFDGRRVTLITFTSWNCTNGYTLRRDFTVPTNDGLRNFWAWMK
jgi:hypothetical protein